MKFNERKIALNITLDRIVIFDTITEGQTRSPLPQLTTSDSNDCVENKREDY